MAINANQNDLTSGNMCFLASFATVTQIDLTIKDITTILQTQNFYNGLFYDEIKVAHNLAAVYE